MTQPLIEKTSHLSQIALLRRKHDWAALLRYSMAHPCADALRAALSVTRKLVATDYRNAAAWHSLVSFLDAFRPSCHNEPPTLAAELLYLCSEHQRLTLGVLRLFSYLRGCEVVTLAPVSQQAKLLQDSLKAADAAQRFIAELDDPPLTARFCELRAQASLFSGLYQDALNHFLRAAAGFESLAAANPLLYLEKWASTLVFLGTTQADLNQLEAAQDSSQKALAVYSRLKTDVSGSPPIGMAAAHNLLGIVYSRLNDLPLARDSYGRAQVVFRRQKKPLREKHKVEFAHLLNNLGIVQCKLKELKAARKTLEDGIKLVRMLSRKYPGVFELSVARAHHNLGIACMELNDLDSALKNLETARSLYIDLVDELPEFYLPLLGDTLNSLANIQGTIHEWNDAQRNYEQALAIFRDRAAGQPEAYQAKVVMALQGLGDLQNVTCDYASALSTYEEILKVYRVLDKFHPEVYQPSTAQVLLSQGDVQQALSKWEAAESSFQEALQILQKLHRQNSQVYIEDFARALHRLGSLQRQLRRDGEAQANLEAALTVYRTLARNRPQVYRLDVAEALLSLGKLQCDIEDYAGALAIFREAVEIIQLQFRETPELYAYRMARALGSAASVQFVLGQVHVARKNLEQSLGLYGGLLHENSEAYLGEVAAALVNLGHISAATNDLPGARKCFERAGEILDICAQKHPAVYLEHRAACFLSLGQLLRRTSDTSGWPDFVGAREAFRKACACAESQRETFVDLRQRRRVQSAMVTAYELLIQTCVELWERSATKPEGLLREAVEAAEASRSRVLMDLLADEAISPRNAPLPLVGELRALQRRLQQSRLSAEWMNMAPPVSLGLSFFEAGTGLRLTIPAGQGGPKAAPPRPLKPRTIARAKREIRLAQQEFEAKLAEVRAFDSEFDPYRPVRPISFDQAKRLLPKDKPTALVQYVITGECGLAFVLCNNETQRVRLPECNHHQLSALAQAWSDTCQPDKQRGKSDAAPIQDQMRLWLARWEQILPNLLKSVTQKAIAPVLEALPEGVERLILCPNRALHLFPLHACPIRDGRPLAADFEVSYAPSLSMLQLCAARHRPTLHSGLLIQNPTSDLDFADIESFWLQRRFPKWKCLAGSSAVRDSIMQQASQSGVIHFCGHASFDASDTLNSGLILGNDRQRDQWLTLRHAFTELNLKHNSLTVLNGCESGMLVADKLDECPGLAGAFLHAGAQCVVSTLWAVHDLPSALLMNRFYERWAAGDTPAMALRESQRWLREDIRSGSQLQETVIPDFIRPIEDKRRRQLCRQTADQYARKSPHSPPFASALYWAPFFCSGLAYPSPDILKDH